MSGRIVLVAHPKQGEHALKPREEIDHLRLCHLTGHRYSWQAKDPVWVERSDLGWLHTLADDHGYSLVVDRA